MLKSLLPGSKVDLNLVKMQVRNTTDSEKVPIDSVGSAPVFGTHHSHQFNKGWYFLQLDCSGNCIGGACTVRIADETPLCLSFGSRASVKRLIYAASTFNATSIEVSNFLFDSTSLRLTRVTEVFARNRMLAKLKYLGIYSTNSYKIEKTASCSTPLDCLDTSDLYLAYSSLFEREAKPREFNNKHSLQLEKCNWVSAVNALHLRNPFSDSPLMSFVEIISEDGSFQLPPSIYTKAQRVGLELSCVSFEEFCDGKTHVDEESLSFKEKYLLFLPSNASLIQSSVAAIAHGVKTTKKVLYFDELFHVGDGGQVTAEAGMVTVCHPDWNPDMQHELDFIGDCLLLRMDWVHAVRIKHKTWSSFIGAVHTHILGELHDTDVERVSAPVVERLSLRPLCLYRPLIDCKSRLMHAAPLFGLGLLAHTREALWPLSNPVPNVEIVIPTRDNYSVLRTCVDSICALTDYPSYRVSVVDNDSHENSTLRYLAELASRDQVVVRRQPGRFNYSALNNRAVEESKADVVVLLNNDTEIIHPNWLEKLIRHAIRPQIGCVGAKLLYSNGLIQHAGVVIGIRGIAGHVHRYFDRDANGYADRLKVAQNVSAVTGACLAVRRDTYLAVGGLDEVNLPVSYNDVDFCLRVQALGLRNLWTPYVELYHHESMSRGGDTTRAKRKRAQQEFHYMQKRWGTADYDDPAYNPNLTRLFEDFGPKHPLER